MKTPNRHTHSSGTRKAAILPNNITTAINNKSERITLADLFLLWINRNETDKNNPWLIPKSSTMSVILKAKTMKV